MVSGTIISRISTSICRCSQLIVVTGLSGSGKSSLAFDTLFAEGQRRYIETFSPYARQFFDRMDKPQVDSIEGIPPAIAIEQRNAVKSTRSTVGTMTEICDYMKVLWPQIAATALPPVRRSPCKRIRPAPSGKTVVARTGCSAPPTAKSLSLSMSRCPTNFPSRNRSTLITKQGYQRLLAPRSNRPARRIAAATRKRNRPHPSR